METSIEIKAPRELIMTRKFAAPRDLVWEAMSKPEYVKRWYGLAILTLTVCEIDLRVGGRWRFVLRAPDGSEHGFTGEYLQIQAPEKIVHTENYEPLGPGHEIRVTTTFAESEGVTTMSAVLLYQSEADRDAHLQSGMAAGANESHDRLAGVLTELMGGTA